MKGKGSLRHTPRKCVLSFKDDFDGYGFYLHELEEVKGHFVGGVERGSPAQAAGLKLGDRIIEINGSAVQALGHFEAVKKIQALRSTVTLLVVDPETDRHFSKQRTRIHSGMMDVQVIDPAGSGGVYHRCENTPYPGKKITT